MKQRLVILSAEHKTQDDLKNFFNTSELRNDLTNMGVSFVEGEGFFDGHKEVSFAVNIDNNKLEHDIISLSKKYNQDAVLVNTFQGIALLEEKNGNVTKLGRLTEVSEDEAKLESGYSKFNGKFYIVR